MSNNTLWTTDHYGNSVRVAASISDNHRFIDNTDYRNELTNYRKELEIRRLMMNRTGVCG
jgi:hypothetical protein